MEVEVVEAGGGHDVETQQHDINLLSLGQLSLITDLLYDECH